MTKADVISILRQRGQRGTDQEVIAYLLAQLERLSSDVETDEPNATANEPKN
jgi:hypothetical protein